MAFKWFRLIASLCVLGLAGYMAWNGATDLSAMIGDDVGAMDFVGPVFHLVIAGAVIVIAFWFLWTPSAVHRNLENIFSIPELLIKLGFTLGLLCIYRIGFSIPLPGLNQHALAQMMEQAGSSAFGQALNMANMFSGGNLRQSTLFGLGIMPYISASIVMQLLTTVIPALEKLQKEGPAGTRKIQEYTRYLTVGLCLFQATMWMTYMRSSGMLYPEVQHGFSVMLIGIVGLTTGTIFLMWLGEQIDEYGIGNGISLLIMAGIVARLPQAITEFATNFELTNTFGDGGYGPAHAIMLVLMFLFVVAGAILITQAQRRIPIQQAKHTRGRRVYGGQRQYLPLRINHGGVMPIIFASAIMIFPSLIFSKLYEWLPNVSFLRMLADGFRQGAYLWVVIYVGMIFFFAYFWTTVQFRPKEMAEQLRDHGSFIPGLRPGKRTAEYLEKVMERITYCGAAFLSIIAVLPMVIASQLGIAPSISAFLGGTGLLIMVSVALDLVQKIESNLTMRNYGGFLGGSTRIKGAYR
jgi:preprotein translocase subunit SecY